MGTWRILKNIAAMAQTCTITSLASGMALTVAETGMLTVTPATGDVNQQFLITYGEAGAMRIATAFGASLFAGGAADALSMCVDMIAADDIRGTFWYADQCIYHHHNGQPMVFNATLNFGARIEGVALQQWNIQQVGAAAEVTDAQLEAAVDEVIEETESLVVVDEAEPSVEVEAPTEVVEEVVEVVEEVVEVVEAEPSVEIEAPTEVVEELVEVAIEETPVAEVEPVAEAEPVEEVLEEI